MGAKVAGRDMIVFDSVCESVSGRQTEQVQAVGDEGEEGKHQDGGIGKGGPLGPPLDPMGHCTYSRPDVKLAHLSKGETRHFMVAFYAA